MNCLHCGIELSDKVCRLHMKKCKIVKQIKPGSPKNPTENYNDMSRKDLIVLILSECEGYKEKKLLKSNTRALVRICEKEFDQ